MPRVEQYQSPRVASQVTRGPLASNVDSDAFGAPIAQGLNNLAAGVNEMQNRIDTTQAEEALVAFEREKNDIFFNPDSGYFNKQGRDAFDGANDTNKSLVDLKSKYEKTLTSDTARQMFGRSADAHITRGNTDIMRHAAKGMQAYEVATLNAQVENTVENASLYWNDPERLGVQKAIGEQAIIDSAEMQGLTGEPLAEKLQTYRSSFNRASISAAISQSAAKGKAAMEAYGDELEGPDKIKLDAALAQKVKVETTQAQARYANVTAVNLVDKYDNLGDMRDEVNRISDPDLRAKTMREVTYQYNMKKSIDKERQAASYDQGIEFINEGGSPSEFQANNPEAWEGMTAQQRNNLLNGKHMVTDQIKLQSLLNLPKSELAKIDPNDTVHDFKPSDTEKLRSAVNAAKKGQSVTRITTLSSKVTSIAEGLYGKKSTWNANNTKRKNVNNLMTVIQDAVEDAEVEKGGKLLPSEEDALLSQFTRDITIQKSLGGVDFLYPDRELNLSNTPASDMREINVSINSIARLNNVEPDAISKDVVTIVDMLVEAGVPVTRQNIQKAYTQATQ